ncbi:MAG: hypothetical protein ABI137_13200 [Antricoccus sp.]
MTPSARRLTLAGALGLIGAGLSVLAGLTQLLLGHRIPAWSGNKSDTVGLGLLSILLGGIAFVAAVSLRRPAATSPGRRVGALAGLLVPAGLCLSTIGRLSYVPAVLLLAAAITVIAAGDIRNMIQATTQHWLQVLLSVLGGLEVLLAISAAPLPIAVIGAFSGVLLLAAPWLPVRASLRAALILIAVIPFASLTWTSLITPLIALLAIFICTCWWRGIAGEHNRRLA